MLVIILISVMSFTKASAQPYTFCEQAGIHSFYTFGFENWGWEDHCKKSPMHDQPEWIPLILKIKALNEKTAKALHTTVEELFRTRKLNIRMERDSKGSLGSMHESESNDLVLTEFDSFTAKSFNDKVYLHELTHWIAAQPGTPIDHKLGPLKEDPFLTETIANWLSYEISGIHALGLSEHPNLNIPACLKDINADVKLSDPAIKFSYGYAAQQLHQCCIDSQPTDEDLVGFCDVIHQGIVESIENRIPSDPQWNASLSTALSTRICKTGDCDPHQFSHAIMPFIIELQKLAGKKLFFEFLNGAELENQKNSPVKVGAVFKRLRAKLTPEARLKFDRLWTKYHMSVL